jgi:hypothetical protein
VKLWEFKYICSYEKSNHFSLLKLSEAYFFISFVFLEASTEKPWTLLRCLGSWLTIIPHSWQVDLPGWGLGSLLFGTSI